MKRKLAYFEENPPPSSNLDVEIVAVGDGAPKRRKLVKIIEGIQYVVSDRKLRIYIDQTRNDLDFIQSKLFGNMDFVVGGSDHPHLLSEAFLDRLQIDYVCQISYTTRDVHPENVIAKEIGKLIVIIPRRGRPPRHPHPEHSTWESFRFGLPPPGVAPPPPFAFRGRGRGRGRGWFHRGRGRGRGMMLFRGGASRGGQHPRRRRGRIRGPGPGRAMPLLSQPRIPLPFLPPPVVPSGSRPPNRLPPRNLGSPHMIVPPHPSVVFGEQ